MTSRAALCLAVVLLSGNAAAEAWTPVASRGVFRSAHASARLASGKLLLAGGQFEPCLSLADLFDPNTFEWTAAPPMKEGRGYFCAVRLDGGKRVFVAGGTVTQIDGLATGARSTAEIYDETTNTWTLAKAMSEGRNNQYCGALPDGRVLVVGGTGDSVPALSTVEIYDPKTDVWSAGPSLPTALEATRGAVLPSGDHLVVGGGQAFLWSSATSTWISPGAAHAIPTRARVAALEDGRVLVIGEGTPVIYDPAAKTWSDLPALKENHIGASMAQIPGNRLLVTGGLPKLAAGTQPLSTVEIFDGKSNTWVEAPPMLVRRATHSADPIEPGRVLVVGAPVTTSEEIWNALPGVQCTLDSQCGSGACIDGYCCDRRCDGACEACDVKGKEGTCTPIDGTPHVGHPSCAPYRACTSGHCASSCASDAECSPGDICFASVSRCGPDRKLCGEDGNLVAPDGTKTSCAPYVCGPNGECQSTCATTLDCMAGSVCDASSNKCVAAVPKSNDDGGGCATTFAFDGSPLWLLALVAVWAVRRRRRIGPAIVIATLLVSSRAGAESWRPTRPMTVTTRDHVPLVRLEDGRVLVAGGATDNKSSSAELYDPSTDTWTTNASSLSAPRHGHSATLLTDGRVLFVGGRRGTVPTDAVDIFDPKTGAIGPAPKIPGARALHAAIRLDDGRVLVAGGVGGGDANILDAKIFDPATSAWSPAGTMNAPHAFGAIARLPDGRVLFAGGPGGKKVDLFDPKTGAWTAGPDMSSAHEEAAAVVLGDGRIVVVGASTTADVFDPTSGAWSALANGLAQRYSTTATLLPSGEILIVGGSDSGLTMLFRTSELLDPVAKMVRPGPQMASPRTAHAATSLKDGRVLVVGGIASVDENVAVNAVPLVFELLDGSPCGDDRECASAFCTDGRCCKTRCHEACNACDVAGSVGTCVPSSGKPRKDHATCSPFGVCIVGACAAICANDSYCDDAHVCDVATGACVEPKSKCEGADAVDTLTGDRKSCAPYACARGKCGSRCATTDECSGGAVCDQGLCAQPSGADEGGGCSYGARAGSGAFAAAALVLGAIRSRRSRAKARPPCRTRI